MTDPDPPVPEPVDDAADLDIVAPDEGSGAVLGLSPAEAAVAAAVALLSGPGLDLPADRPDPADVERSWSSEARESLEHLVGSLEGRRVGLAISGGGSLGSFEAGALRFLYDHVRVASYSAQVQERLEFSGIHISGGSDYLFKPIGVPAGAYRTIGWTHEGAGVPNHIGW